MTALEKNIAVPVRWIIIVSYAIFAIGCIIYIFFINNSADASYINNNKIAILGGLSASMIVALTQFFISWYEHKMFDEFKKLGIIDVLPNKYDQNKYSRIIRNIDNRLWIMGNTARDLLDHFANQSEEAPDDQKVLLSILAIGKDVRLLLAQKDHLSSEQIANFDISQKKLADLKKQYSNLEFKYYKHAPAQSIFIFDNECFLGPIFPNKKSRETPCLRMTTDNIFAKKYIEYFDREWEIATCK